MSSVYSVSQITASIKELLEAHYPFLWVQGQVGTVSRPGSGHIYLTLKDESSSLAVAWFRSSQSRSGLSPDLLQTGAEILCAGRIAVYGPRGVYQLIAEMVLDRGTGSLHLQFETLKRKLAEQGYFEEGKKLTLPEHPRRVTVITASESAALRDFLRLTSHRGWPGEIRIRPCPVQGEAAAERLAHALQEADQEGWAQVIALIRGGGSLEDLFSFNSEVLAEAIHHCRTPVLTGIGHEMDLTIADMVADMRASTPSHAAQLLWPEREQMMQQLDEIETSLYQAWKNMYLVKTRELESWSRALGWLSPARRLAQLGQSLELCRRNLLQASKHLLQKKNAELQLLRDRLQKTYTSESWRLREQNLQALENSMLSAMKDLLRSKHSELERLDNGLYALDPYLPLKRGYSLVTVTRTEELLRSAEQVESGEEVSIQTYRDQLTARIK